jgi:hypothetical protein
MGSGAGKSVLVRLLIAQFLHNGCQGAGPAGRAAPNLAGYEQASGSYGGEHPAPQQGGRHGSPALRPEPRMKVWSPAQGALGHRSAAPA